MILDTRNYQESVQTLTDNIQTKFVESGAEVSEVKNLGQFRFEHAVDRKFPEGLYLQIAFSSDPHVAEVLKTKFQLDHTVNRILIENK